MPATPKKNPKHPGKNAASSTGVTSVRCSGRTTTGDKCKRYASPGLKVCSSHGGGTATSRGKSKKARVADKVSLWGLADNVSGVDVVTELNRLATQKSRDILALRIELGSNPDKYHGMMDVQEETTSSDTSGTGEKLTRKLSTHPLVEELHKSENELVQVLRLLQEVGGETTDADITRIRLQTARETARLLKAYPGMGVDEAAAEVAKRV